MRLLFYTVNLSEVSLRNQVNSVSYALTGNIAWICGFRYSADNVTEQLLFEFQASITFKGTKGELAERMTHGQIVEA